jgi:hypothetical protein
MPLNDANRNAAGTKIPLLPPRALTRIEAPHVPAADNLNVQGTLMVPLYRGGHFFVEELLSALGWQYR